MKLRYIKYLLALLALAGLFSVPYYVESGYYIYIIILLFTYITMASSWNILAGFAGQVCLGNGAFFGAGAFTMLIAIRLGYGTLFSMLIGIAMATGLALALIPLFRLRGAYFAIGTLFFAFAVQLAYIYRQAILFEELIITVPIGEALPVNYYYTLALLLALASVLTAIYISKSRFSYALNAIRDDEDVAEELGINPIKYKLMALLIAAFYMGCAGAIFIHFAGRGYPPNLFGLTWSINPVFITILGGIGTIFGPIVGAAIFVLLSEMFTGLLRELSLLVWAITLVALIHIAPQGVYGFIKQKIVERRAISLPKLSS